jgi:4-amino-4-deoxy-L-arabinose transferase-like glycosyltransferase
MASVARNYLSAGCRPAAPEIDRAGPVPAPAASGFPVYPFALACICAVTGAPEIPGRVLSLVSSLLALWYLYRLVRGKVDEDTARWSAFFFAILPLNAFYGRALAPESAVIACAIVGVYYFGLWLEKGSFRAWLLSAVLVSAACLVNYGFWFLALPLGFLAWRRHHKSLARNAALFFYAVLVLVPASVWLAHAHGIFVKTGLTVAGEEAYRLDFREGLAMVRGWDFWNRVVFQRLAERHLTWFGFAACVWGFVLKRRTDNEKVFDFWLAGALAYAVVSARGGDATDLHQLAFIVPATVFMGKVYARYYHLRLWRSGASAALVFGLAGLILTSAWRYGSLLLAEDVTDSAAWQVSRLLAEKTEEGAAVVAVDEGDPADLYYARRRGWCVGAAEFAAGGEKLLDSYAARGAGYAAGMHESFVPEALAPAFKRLLKHYPAVHDDGRYFILRLKRLRR